MKKFGLIYLLSFLSYSMFLLYLSVFTTLYPVVELGAFVLGILSAASFIYEITYIVYLRRKENISLPRSIARFFLYLLISIGLYVIFFYIYVFFAGLYFGFIGNGARYYGFEAWGILNAFYLWLLFIPPAIYAAIYYIVSNKKLLGKEDS